MTDSPKFETKADPLEASFDAVLMDMQMPIMDGIECTRKIRQAGITAEQLPIVALTANAFSEDREACAAAGMQDHVSKPIQFNDLYKAVCKWYFEPRSKKRTPEVEEKDETIASLRPKYEEFRNRTLDRLMAGMATINHWSVEQSDEIAGMLHKLVGSAGSFGEGEMAAAAKQLEDAIKQDKPVDVLRSLSNNLLTHVRQDTPLRANRA